MRSGRRKTAFAWQAAALIASLAAIPSAVADQISGVLAEAGITGPAAAALAQKSGAFGPHGILPDAVLNKVREGAAKGVAPEAIAAAASRLADRMLEAAEIYPGKADAPAKTAAVEAAAKAMIAGAGRDLARQTFDALAGSALPRAEWHRAFGALASLAASGAEPAAAAEIVREAVARGLKPTEISALPGRHAGLIASGKAAADAAGMLLHEVKTGAGAKDFPRGPDRVKPAPGLERDDKDRDADPTTIRGSGKAKFKDKSKEKKTPPGQEKK
jgi:hypothetical protein